MNPFIFEGDNIVINCAQHNFDGYLKMGDTVAVLNIIQCIRNINNNPNIKFYIPDSEMYKYDYVLQFKRFLEKTTDYFSDVKGQVDMVTLIEPWSYRVFLGESLEINNPEPQQKKICLFPLLDANYNQERNWPRVVLEELIQKYSNPIYENYQKIICIKDETFLNEYDIQNFEVSTDFYTNLQHILTCSDFVGGDTGASHFASVLTDIKNLTYFYNKGFHGSWRSEFTAPFYIRKGKGTMVFYEKY